MGRGIRLNFETACALSLQLTSAIISVGGIDKTKATMQAMQARAHAQAVAQGMPAK
jgi:hypothetical protein